MKVKVGRGDNSLETMAVDDRLKSMGVTMDPLSRTVDDQGAKGSQVKGGVGGLAKAAAAGGDKNVLEPDELSNIPTGLIAGFKTSSRESKAKAKVDEAIASIQTGSAAIDEFLQKTSFTIHDAAGLFRRILAMANKVEQVTAPGTIGYTSTAQRNELRLALATYATHTGALWGTLSKVIDQDVLPFRNKLAARYNDTGDRWGGCGIDALMAAESAAGASVDTLNLISRNLGNLAETHASLMRNAKLFASDLT